MKLPFVRRSALDTLITEMAALRTRTDEAIKAVAAHWQARVAECEQRAIAAETRAAAADDRALKALEQARLVMADALGLSKMAANTLFGVEENGEIEAPLSVRAADAAAARKIREQRESER